MLEDDGALVSRSKNGDLDAFEALIRRYQSRVCRTLYFLLSNQDDVEDVAQEVFIRVYRHLSAFRGDCEFSTWLHRVTLNTLRNWTRTNKPSLSLETIGTVSSHNHIVQFGNDTGFLSHEDTMVVRKILSELPKHYSEALILRHFQQLPYEEIARIQHVPVGTVRSRLSKGRDLLMNRLIQAGVSITSGRKIAK